jgi:large subunit ribosomal protein L25
MPTTIAAEARVASGSRAANRLRGEDKIPGVIYGHGMDPVLVTVNRRELRVALSGAAGSNTVLDLKVDGKVHSTVIKELQRHKVRHNVTHIDFQVVRMDEEITVDVPVVLHGEAKAVLNDGGLVDPSVDTLPIVTTPRNIPTEIAIDITDMQVGDVIRVADIVLPAGVTTSADPDMPVVTVLVTRAAVAAESEAVEATEGDADKA